MKDNAVQQIRVSAMVFIVLYHCVCYYGIWRFQDTVKYGHIEYWRSACYFALNAFVFISGLLYARLYPLKEKYRDRRSLLKDKVNRLLLPYCLWAIIAMLLFPADEPVKRFLWGIHHLWFLLMLMGLFLIISLLGKKILKPAYLAIAIASSLAINAAANRYGDTIPPYAAWKEVLRYLPAFFVGAVTVQLRVPEFFSRLPKAILFVSTFVSFVLVVLTTVSPVLPFGILYMEIPTYLLLVCIYSILTIYPVKIESTVMDNLDKNSMGIYIIHHLLIWAFILYVPSAEVFLIAHSVLSPILMFTVFFALSWYLADRLGQRKPTSLLFNFNKLNQIPKN